MEDKGKKLYEMYADNLERHGVGVDGWDALEHYDRQAWRETAEQILAGEL